ncbi:hypothetical protein MKW98_030166 [Papaver atlanticum]|uniref:Morc S5 domain-containing protein n=1 Tax=Papaver atlanticum TaxID=357466 RepID=A0AAD4SRE8_9MAGN|nr:hypothetical protein MKW98_030166 [Papaver atlanticum]
MSFTPAVDLSSDDETRNSNANYLLPGDVVDVLSSDDETRDPKGKGAKQGRNLLPGDVPQARKKFPLQPESINGFHSSSGMFNQGQENHTVEGPTAYASSSSRPAPLTRQFWKTGSYESVRTPAAIQNGRNHLRVHPKFLHSNATSHKWAFGGKNSWFSCKYYSYLIYLTSSSFFIYNHLIVLFLAMAELLDNAVDEIRNGGTFVMVDKIKNPRDGSPALLIQDDGGGMNPKALRRCMSFGFSDKKSNSIGQYGNGFKTSTMRLGADVLVFSRCNQRTLTQTVGLLSYTFLRQTCYDRIAVPMVDFEYNKTNGKFGHLIRSTEEHFSFNLSMLLKWSPYKTKAELMKQFNDLGTHGTKVIIYNLWFTDDGEMELNFESDGKDIQLPGAPEVSNKASSKALCQQHLANKLHYSLREYLSILYLRLPEHFRIILRGKVVRRHNIADDLKFIEYILYKPHMSPNSEDAVVTTIGLLKDAPMVNIHGFCVYHKNRLIMPFWNVVSQNDKGRGVVGALEVNFIQPTHNKQEFEKTTVFQRLQSRLKGMTLEYWDKHSELIGYQQRKKKPSTSEPPPVSKTSNAQNSSKMSWPTSDDSTPGVEPTSGVFEDHELSYPRHTRQANSAASSGLDTERGMSLKRKKREHITEPEITKRQAYLAESATNRTLHSEKQIERARIAMQENQRLRALCLEFEKSEEELNLKVEKLKTELAEVDSEYDKLLAEFEVMHTLMESFFAQNQLAAGEIGDDYLISIEFRSCL